MMMYLKILYCIIPNESIRRAHLGHIWLTQSIHNILYTYVSLFIYKLSRCYLANKCFVIEFWLFFLI